MMNTPVYKNIFTNALTMTTSKTSDHGFYQFASSQFGDLLECQKCHIEFDFYKLSKSESGKFLCKYCLLKETL